MTSPAAMVVVPTHDHAATLGFAVHSALEQTVAAVDVVVIGDGVGDDTRDVMAALCREDARVRFVDREKVPGRNEAARHEVVTACAAPIVTYLGDDDLLLPDHLATMSVLLAGHDFAHPFPVMIDDDGTPYALPTDLADPTCVTWHLDPRLNTIGLTGATHTMDLYRRLPHGWRPAPPGWDSDHHMWVQIFSIPGVRLATGRRCTIVKPPSVDRAAHTAAERAAEMGDWWERLHRPGFDGWWQEQVTEAVRRAAVNDHRDVGYLHIGMNAARHDADRVSTELASVQQHVAAMEATRTWRIRRRLAAQPLLRRLFARQPPEPGMP